MIKLAVIIPTRGDRPELLSNCARMIQAQTFKPETVLYIDHPPVSDAVDITHRYRVGYEAVCGEGFDLIAFMEDDDWYAPNYLEAMTRKWAALGKPDLFGTNMSIYYHIFERKYFTMRHAERSAMMNTFIKPDLTFDWPLDHDPYTDVWLWMGSRKKGMSFIDNTKVFEPSKIMSLGIKHGVGKTGGHNHTDKMNRFINDDHDMYWLKNTIDEESFEFYSNFKP